MPPDGQLTYSLAVHVPKIDGFTEAWVADVFVRPGEYVRRGAFASPASRPRARAPNSACRLGRRGWRHRDDARKGR